MPRKRSGRKCSASHWTWATDSLGCPALLGNRAMVDAAQELARRMLADFDARTPGQLFGEPLDLTTVQAYALQAEIARLREERGERVIGYKVGCTSAAVQQQLG